MTLVEDVIHKPSGLNEIAPDWAKRLVHQKLPFTLSFTWFKWYFELDSPSKCVVREAYGYTSSYEGECRDCSEFGWRFGDMFMTRSKEGIEDNIRMFVAHWSDKHAQLSMNLTN